MTLKLRPLSDMPFAPIAAATTRPVFVVDDDPALLGSLEFNLEIEGFAVETFVNAAGLLPALEGRDKGCLIVDYNLPDGNGLDLLESLRRRGNTMPAILITTAPSAAMLARAAAIGVEVVEKPLFDNALIEAVQRALPV